MVLSAVAGGDRLKGKLLQGFRQRESPVRVVVDRAGQVGLPGLGDHVVRRDQRQPARGRRQQATPERRCAKTRYATTAATTSARRPTRVRAPPQRLWLTLANMMVRCASNIRAPTDQPEEARRLPLFGSELCHSSRSRIHYDLCHDSLRSYSFLSRILSRWRPDCVFASQNMPAGCR
jgi:hypothetical protein